jgi:hypothetical protein
VSSPWWIYNVAWFGSLMPISGSVNRGSHLGNPAEMMQMLDAVTTGLTPYLYAWRMENTLLSVIRVVPAAACIALVVRAPALDAGGDARDEGARVLRTALLYAGVLCAWYLTQSRTSYFYARYLMPAALVGVAVAAGAIGAWCARGSRGIRVAAATLAVLAAAAAWVAPLATGRGEGSAMFRDQLALVREHVPPDARVGALQAGTLGYFRDGVVNLDGRVNPDVRPGASRLAYVYEVGIEWICDDRRYVSDGAGLGQLGPPWRLVDTARRFELWTRAPR